MFKKWLPTIFLVIIFGSYLFQTNFMGLANLHDNFTVQPNSDDFFSRFISCKHTDIYYKTQNCHLNRHVKWIEPLDFLIKYPPIAKYSDAFAMAPQDRLGEKLSNTLKNKMFLINNRLEYSDITQAFLLQDSLNHPSKVLQPRQTTAINFRVWKTAFNLETRTLDLTPIYHQTFR